MITHQIIGDDMQAVVITMAAGDEVRAEAGAMTYMTEGIGMDARMTGGLLGGLKRKFLAGESLFLTFFRCSSPGATVAFSGPYPGKIIRMPLQNSAILCQRDSFLCAAGPIDINVEFTRRLGAGFFGGEGFILQRIEGDGLAFLHASGTLHEIALKPGESLRHAFYCGLSPAKSEIEHAIRTTTEIEHRHVGNISTKPERESVAGLLWRRRRSGDRVVCGLAPVPPPRVPVRGEHLT